MYRETEIQPINKTDSRDRNSEYIKDKKNLLNKISFTNLQFKVRGQKLTAADILT